VAKDIILNQMITQKIIVMMITSMSVKKMKRTRMVKKINDKLETQVDDVLYDVCKEAGYR
jgi:hypothetical protein